MNNKKFDGWMDVTSDVENKSPLSKMKNHHQNSTFCKQASV